MINLDNPVVCHNHELMDVNKILFWMGNDVNFYYSCDNCVKCGKCERSQQNN